MTKKSDQEILMKELKMTILLASRQTRKGKTVSADKMTSLSRLVNSYVKVLKTSGTIETGRPAGMSDEQFALEYGDPDFAASLTK